VNFEIKGILFDLDGTLIDSSEVIVRAWQAFADKHNLEFNEIFSTIQGKPAGESIAALLPDASREEIESDTIWMETLEASDTEGVVALPGSVIFLNALIRENVPWGIVTSGTAPVATARIKAADLPPPEVLITPELVSKGKPDPEPYQLGSEKLGVDIKQCVVFEDAPAGVRSGVSAGATVIGVTTQFDSSVLMAEKASTCIATLLDVVYQGTDKFQFTVVCNS